MPMKVSNMIKGFYIGLLSNNTHAIGISSRVKMTFRRLEYF